MLMLLAKLIIVLMIIVEIAMVVIAFIMGYQMFKDDIEDIIHEWKMSKE